MAAIFRKLSSIASRSSRNHTSLSNSSHLLTSASTRLASSFRSRVHSPCNGAGAKRYYYVDRYNVEHFRKRGPRRWLENPRTVLIVAITGGGALVSIYFWNIDTVPYTNRSRFVLLSKDMERELGERKFDQLRDSFRGSILSSSHPLSIRVSLISRRIIDSLNRGLRNEQVWSDLGCGNPSLDSAHGDLSLESLHVLGNEEHWYKNSQKEELLDENWAKSSRQKGVERGAKPENSHLKSFKWEVIVVNSPIVNAFCLPGAKIVIFTGLLKAADSDSEIAAIISHEVAHAVARHGAEQMTKSVFFATLQLMLCQFIIPDLANVMSQLLLRLPFSRKMEIEADHIGVLLMASAGYDPRTAPLLFEKLGKVFGDSALNNYLSTHPSGKKRAQLLSNAHVMEEALSLYRESIAGKHIEGFL